MAAERFLVVNADDFGQSPGVNRGVISAHQRGIVTSASLMVRWPAAAEAASFGQTQPDLSLGLHFDLGEWAYREPDWVPVYDVVPTDDAVAVADELQRQLAKFRQLVGRNPTHIDSHQHVHLDEPVRSLLIQAARELAVPVRHFTPAVRYSGAFYGQTRTGTPFPSAISVEALMRVLATLPPGATELGCHPGEGDDLHGMYRAERAQEVAALCDPQIRAALVAKNVELCSFSDVTARLATPRGESEGQGIPK